MSNQTLLPGTARTVPGTPHQPDAFALQLTSLREVLYGFLRRRLSQPDLVEDAAQETYLRMLRYRHIERQDELRALLLRVADNVVKDGYRRNEVRSGRVFEDNLQERPDTDAPCPERVTSGSQDWQRVKQVILALPPRCRSAFVLHRFQHMSYEEIAQLHGTSIRTVENQIATALRACRTAMSATQDVPHAAP